MLDIPYMNHIRDILRQRNEAYVNHMNLINRGQKVNSSYYNRNRFEQQVEEEKKELEEIEEMMDEEYDEEEDDEYEYEDEGEEEVNIPSQAEQIQGIIQGSGNCGCRCRGNCRCIGGAKKKRVNKNIEKIKNIIIEEAKKNVNKGGAIGSAKYKKTKSKMECKGGEKPAIIEIREKTQGAGKKGRPKKMKVEIKEEVKEVKEKKKRGRPSKMNGGRANIMGMIGVGPSSQPMNQPPPPLPPPTGGKLEEKEDIDITDLKLPEAYTKAKGKKVKEGKAKRKPTAWNEFVSKIKKETGKSMKDTLKHIKENKLWKK
jgi:hypothetical protein